MIMKTSHRGFAKGYVTDVFLLGAGFSKAISAEMPTLRELSRQILNRQADALKGFPDYLYDDVEAALAYLGARYPWKSEATYHSHLGYALALLEEIGRAIGAAERKAVEAWQGHVPNWLVRLAHWLHDEHASVITFNYDTLVERAFSQIRVDGSVPPTFLNPIGLIPIDLQEPELRWEKPSYATAELLKLHGSTNWLYSGAREFFGEQLYYVPLDTAGWQAPEGKVPLIVPPVSDKPNYFNHEGLRLLWSVARSRIQFADRIYCIGFSFPETDLAIRFLLGEHGRPGAEMYIVNPDTSVAERVRRFVNQRWRVRTDFVKDTGIVDLVENLCSKTRTEVCPQNIQVPLREVRGRVQGRLQAGDRFPGAPNGEFEVLRLDQDAIYIEESLSRIPYQLTWFAIASVVEHLKTMPRALKIGGSREDPPTSSVDALMRNWYARHCGNAVAGLLVASEISRGSNTHLEGLTESFRAELTT